MKLVRLIPLLILLACSPLMAGNMGIDTTAATSDGTVRAGAKQVILVFSSDFAGTVNGVSYTWAAGGSVNFGPMQNDNLVAITYTVSSGTLRIIRVQ